MKRILALVLSLAMILVVFLMAGCGDDPTETTGSSSTSGTTGSGSETNNTSGTSGGSETTGGSGDTSNFGYRTDGNSRA